MKVYFMALLVLVFVNVFLMLFFMDEYAKSVVAGMKDIAFIVFGSLFLIMLLFIYAFMFTTAERYPSF